MTDILTACVTLFAATLGLLLLEVVLDHLFGLPLIIRQLLLFAGLGAAGYFATTRIVLPLIRSVSGLYAAKTIEDADPAFKNSLINYLNLRRNRDQVPKSFLAAMEARVSDLANVEVDTVINQRRLVWMTYATAGVVLAFCLYVVITPRSITDSIKRAFLADVARPTNTRLVNIKPGENPELAHIVAGTPVTFSVETQGVQPKSVVLRHSVNGGKYFAATDLTRGKGTYDPWSTLIRDPQQNIDYYFTAGDAESKHFHLEILPAPTVFDPLVLDLDFPSYTGIPARTNVEGGNVEAIEGTVVVVHAKTNQPAHSAKIVFGPNAKIEPLDMTVVSGDAKELRGRFTVAHDTTYRVEFVTQDGQSNPNPSIYNIDSIPDDPPTIKVLHPGPLIKRPSNGSVRIIVEANDRYGLTDVMLNVWQADEPLLKARHLLPANPTKAPLRFNNAAQPVNIDLTPLKLKVGSKVEYWLVAKDNKEPISGKAETDKYLIEIVDPLPPQKLAEQNAKDRKDEPPPPASGDESNADDQNPPPSNEKDGQERDAKPQEDTQGQDRQPPKPQPRSGRKRRSPDSKTAQEQPGGPGRRATASEAPKSTPKAQPKEATTASQELQRRLEFRQRRHGRLGPSRAIEQPRQFQEIAQSIERSSQDQKPKTARRQRAQVRK